MFEVIIVSPIFRDLRLLARHKLVNEKLKDEISKVHAFSQVSLKKKKVIEFINRLRDIPWIYG